MPPRSPLCRWRDICFPFWLRHLLPTLSPTVTFFPGTGRIFPDGGTSFRRRESWQIHQDLAERANKLRRGLIACSAFGRAALFKSPPPSVRKRASTRMCTCSFVVRGRGFEAQLSYKLSNVFALFLHFSTKPHNIRFCYSHKRPTSPCTSGSHHPGGADRHAGWS